MEGLAKRNRMSFPLGEMLGALREFKQLLPSLRSMPQKLLRIDTDVTRIGDRLKNEYLTMASYKLLAQYQSSDLQGLMDNIAEQTLNRVESLIETRIPFD